MQDMVECSIGPWCLPPFLEMSRATGARRGEVLALRWCDIRDGAAFIDGCWIQASLHVLTGVFCAFLVFSNSRNIATNPWRRHSVVTRSRFRSNELRLWLSVIAYNLGNLWRRLVLPKRIDNWSLTSLQQRLVKTGGRLVKHARYYWLMLAESHLTRRLFGEMVRRIAGLPAPTG